DRAGLARRRDRQAERRPTRAGGRAEHAPALLRWPAAVRVELALLDLGQPVLPRPEVLAAQDRLRPERRHGDRPRLLRRLLQAARRARTRARGAPPERRLHHGDLPVIAHIQGVPVEESLPQILSAGALAVTAAAVYGRSTLRRLRDRLRTRPRQGT